MKLYVHKLDGSKTKSQVTLSDAVFAMEPNDYAIYQAVRLEEANNRQGTHMTKNRAVVSGGGRKPVHPTRFGRIPEQHGAGMDLEPPFPVQPDCNVRPKY